MIEVDREPIIRPLALIFIMAPAVVVIVGPGGGQSPGLERDANREDGGYGGGTDVSKWTRPECPPFDALGSRELWSGLITHECTRTSSRMPPNNVLPRWGPNRRIIRPMIAVR